MSRSGDRRGRSVQFDQPEEENGEDENGEEEEKPQLSEGQVKALLSELTPKLKEELCHVLHAQGKPSGEQPGVSPELARVLNRFRRRAGLTKPWEEEGDETWLMYIGLGLFVVVFILLAFTWFEDNDPWRHWQNGKPPWELEPAKGAWDEIVDDQWGRTVEDVAWLDDFEAEEDDKFIIDNVWSAALGTRVPWEDWHRTGAREDPIDF
mmetsp:Transcript_18995/g.34292  ORF Transcript_18995/g.34292 Transcript_18995/m.34292 type:complete len:208 (-) Transcript_18995:45-668(-)